MALRRPWQRDLPRRLNYSSAACNMRWAVLLGALAAACLAAEEISESPKSLWSWGAQLARCSQ